MRKLSKDYVVFSIQFALSVLLIAAAAGCATAPIATADSRSFSFEHDTFGYANELKWEYSFAPDGKWSAKKREPPPKYSLHCFVVARSTKQFFQNAKFVKELPRADEATYRTLISKVISANPRRALPNEEKIVIPGYASLREFSSEHERLLKEECGGAWQSYFQRGHWRMLFPFRRAQQEKVAQQFCEKLRTGQPSVAHIVSFPDLKINHAVVLFGVTTNEHSIKFATYDPNRPEAPTTLTFDRQKRAFLFPQNNYFAGGKVDAYEIYSSLLF